MDFVTTYLFSSEIFLSFSILSQLTYYIVFVDKIVNRYSQIKFEIGVQVLFILICSFIILNNLIFEGSLFNFLFIVNEGNRSIKLIILILSALTLAFLTYAFYIQKLNSYEFFIFLLLIIFSSLLLVSCSDLSSFYLIIEMQSLCFYVIATYKRKVFYEYWCNTSSLTN